MSKGALKCLLAEFISAVDDSFDQWNACTEIVVEGVCGPQVDYDEK